MMQNRAIIGTLENRFFLDSFRDFCSYYADMLHCSLLLSGCPMPAQMRCPFHLYRMPEVVSFF